MWYGTIVHISAIHSFAVLGKINVLHNVWFPNLKKPETIVKNIAGVFYKGDQEIISKEDAVKNCLEYQQEFLIKPSIDSGEGRLITFFTPGKYKKEELVKALKKMGANYIVQGVVKQHEILSKLNPSSLNTIRIVSFLFEGEVYILSSILRMGPAMQGLIILGPEDMHAQYMKMDLLMN